MDRPQGVVTHVEAKQVRVMVRRKESCGSCTCADGEGACSAEKSAQRLEVEARCSLPVSLGDRVALDVRHFKKAVLLVYGLPLAAFLGTLLVLTSVAPGLHDLAKAGAAFGALALSLFGLKLLSPRLGSGPHIEVVQVLTPSSLVPGAVPEPELPHEVPTS